MSRQKEPGKVEFIAWIPENGDEDDGRSYWDYPACANDVAAEFAQDYDGDYSEYPDERDVAVKNVKTGEVKTFTVYGENTRQYRAREKEAI